MARTRKPQPDTDPAFRAAIAESERVHHEEWLSRGPGDGLAIVDVVDQKTGKLVGFERVEPRYQAFAGGGRATASKCEGHRCPTPATA